MFTAKDINTVINYTDVIGDKIYKVNAKGQVRFNVLNMHVNDLNKMLTHKLVTEQDFALLKKQVKTALKSG